jgi:DNA invertase Pin-like site-specific DNA recombinase
MRRGRLSSAAPELCQQQIDAIKLIASGCTVRYAALALKIKHSTINRWMNKDETFKNALAERLTEQESNEETKQVETKSKGSSAESPMKRP